MVRLAGSVRRVAVASVVGVACLLMPAAASAAGPHWQKPQILVPIGTATYNPAVATGPDGTTVVVWDEANPKNATFELLSAVRSVSGKVKIGKLGPMSGAFPQASLAVGGDGTFAVAWGFRGKHNRNQAAVRIWRPGKAGFAGTNLLSPGNLSTQLSGGDTPQVAVDDAGTVYVVWEGQFGKGSKKHYEIVERQLAKSATKWSSPRRFAAIHCAPHRKPKCQQVDAHAARVAADGKGNLAISWIKSSGEVVATVGRSDAKTFGKAQQIISPATYGVTPPAIGESDSGKAAVIWEQSVSTGRRIESNVTTGARFPNKGQYLSGKGSSQFQVVALASNGGGVAAWEKLAGSGGQVQARVTKGSSKRWGNIKQLTRPGVALFGTGPSVASANGVAFVAWTQRVKNALAVGVSVMVGNRWQKTRTFPALGSAVVSAANDPVKGTKVLGALVWSTTDGLKLTTFVR
jgi:hypothetical protein